MHGALTIKNCEPQDRAHQLKLRASVQRRGAEPIGARELTVAGPGQAGGTVSARAAGALRPCSLRLLALPTAHLYVNMPNSGLKRSRVRSWNSSFVTPPSSCGRAWSSSSLFSTTLALAR